MTERRTTSGIEDIVARARSVTDRAYAPYSKFKVGAVVEAEDGTLHEGVNIENASYGLTLCAERAAIFSAVAAGHRRFTRIAVTCKVGPGSRIEERTPCGPCRQVMAEFMAPESEVIIDGVGTFQLKSLLPMPFRLGPGQEPNF